MYLVDMHSDSIQRVYRGEPLLTRYNTSERYPKLQFFAHYSKARGISPKERLSGTLAGISVYTREIRKNSLLSVKSREDLRSAVTLGRSAALFSIEGGGGLMPDSGRELRALYEGGLRVFGAVWDENELCASAWSAHDFGLTASGRAVLSEVTRLGIILDVSHMSDRGFWQLSEMSCAPFVATHSNFREVCKSPRNLTREMALEIKRRGGVIGLNLYPPFLHPSGVADESDIIRHIDYALELLGEDTLAFGFDIDGTGGEYPRTYGEHESIHDRVSLLISERYGEGIAERLCGKNAIAFLERNLQ